MKFSCIYGQEDWFYIPGDITDICNRSKEIGVGVYTADFALELKPTHMKGNRGKKQTKTKCTTPNLTILAGSSPVE